MTTKLDINSQPEIVLRAFNEGITDIGQLTPSELRSLKKAVKEGYLSVIPNYRYPVVKNRYAMNLKNYDIMTGELKELK